MVTHDLEKEKSLMLLREGTLVKVKEEIGILVFEPYPENYQEIVAAMSSYVKEQKDDDESQEEAEQNAIEYLLRKFSDSDKEETYEEEIFSYEEKTSKEKIFERKDTRKKLTEEEVHIYARYYNAYEFGIRTIVKEDVNVSPRNIGKPVLRKGEYVVCYEYPAKDYEIIT